MHVNEYPPYGKLSLRTGYLKKSNVQLFHKNKILSDGMIKISLLK